MIDPQFASKYPSLLRSILWNRGFRSNQEVEAFLNPTLSQITHPDECLLDLREAIQLLLDAREKKTRTVIFGDYDVDGTTSAALLFSVLREWGFNVGYYIPHRVKEGYGLTLKAAEAVLDREPKLELLITCDCGVASFEGVAFLKSKGVRVIVTDHHELPPERVGADAVINPKQIQCRYPEKNLAGVGVAFLVLIGLRKALGLREYSLGQHLDLVALGTVCDVAELKGANRVFVRLGLQQLSRTKKLGLQCLLEHLDLYEKTIRSFDLGFVIGPRLNASGRIGEPDLGIRSILAENWEEASPLVQKLEQFNFRRRALQEEQVSQARTMAMEQIKTTPALKTLVVEDSGFHLGIVGLIAAKLAEEFQRPSCVMTEVLDEHELANFQNAKGLWKGSMRTPIGYHLADALQAIKTEFPGLLKSGGGHAMAAGVSLEFDGLKIFRAAFERQIEKQPQQRIEIPVDAELKKFSDAKDVLPLLEPFGAGNPAPLLRIRNFSILQTRVMKDAHLKFWGDLNGEKGSVLHFKSPWVRMFAELEQEASSIDFVAELTENEWRGNKTLELILKDIVELRVRGEKRAIQTKRNANEAGESQSLRAT